MLDPSVRLTAGTSPCRELSSWIDAGSVELVASIERTRGEKDEIEESLASTVEEMSYLYALAVPC